MTGRLAGQHALVAARLPRNPEFPQWVRTHIQTQCSWLTLGKAHLSSRDHHVPESTAVIDGGLPSDSLATALLL